MNTHHNSDAQEIARSAPTRIQQVRIIDLGNTPIAFSIRRPELRDRLIREVVKGECNVVSVNSIGEAKAQGPLLCSC
jgi:hypothetical protein